MIPTAASLGYGLRQQRETMSRRHALVLGTAFALVCFLILLVTAVDVGVTWDEPIYSEAAERSANWLGLVVRGDLQQAFNPTTFGISWGLVNEHPPLVRVLNGLGWAVAHGVLPLRRRTASGTWHSPRVRLAFWLQPRGADGAQWLVSSLEQRCWRCRVCSFTASGCARLRPGCRLDDGNPGF